MEGDPIILTEGDLYEIGDIVHEAIREVLQQVMKQHNVLGALKMQIQDLKEQTP